MLGSELRQRGYVTLADAAAAGDQEGTFDVEEFQLALDENLSSGHFRVVLVLDEAPAELVRLVGYLEAVAGDLLIDLITVAAYEINGSRIIVPQRVDPERRQRETPLASREAKRAQGYLSDGAADFIDAIDRAPRDHQASLRKLAEWATRLESEGLVRLKTYRGKGRWTLLPRLVADNAGLVTIWNDNGAYLSVWRSVFERRAPSSIEHVESLIGTQIGNGNTIRDFRDAVLDALTDAYREAAGSQTRPQITATTTQ